MKKNWFLLLSILTLLIFANSAKAQNWGLGIGYGTSSSIHADFSYLSNQNVFHIGGTYQFSNTKGKLLSEQGPNHGRTVDGRGQYFWTIDFGYGRYLTEKLSVHGELSVGAVNDFTNYVDNRFSGGGYHMIDSTEITGGIGANVGYGFSDSVSGFVGYNTLREITFGIRLIFPTL